MTDSENKKATAVEINKSLKEAAVEQVRAVIVGDTPVEIKGFPAMVVARADCPNLIAVHFFTDGDTRYVIAPKN